MRGPFWIILLLATLIQSSPAPAWNTKKQLLVTYDYIVIGCGASGLTVANRLSERLDFTILCIEAGPLDNDEPEIIVPYYIGLQPQGFYDWQIHTTPQHHLDGATRHIPMGKGVGGGTLINGMIWNRGNQESYRSWADMGNLGWAWGDLLPYFMRSEAFTPKTYTSQQIPPIPFPENDHGSNGPVQVSYPNYFWTQSNSWFQALESLGIPTAADPNSGLSAGGYFLPLSLDPKNQTRSDARRAYYDAARFRQNFHLLTNTLVTKIIFDTRNGLHATGVEYTQAPNGPRMIVYANREVVLAAGAIHTPQILELSGIGQASILAQFGIKVLEDLPGVGNNLQDHALIHLNYPYANSAITTVTKLQTNHTFDMECENEYYRNKTGPWTAKPSQAVAFPSLRQVTANADALLNAAVVNASHYLPSNYESTLQAGYREQLLSIVTELRSNSIPVFENLNNNAGGLDLALMRPLSRGTCHINSTDPFEAPAVDPRWLIHPFDYDVMITAMQFNQRLLETPALAALQPTYLDVPYNASLDQLGQILRSRIGTEYHYCGTAAMLPRELGGVVDPYLVVYGTDNLRIVDSSVFPMVPGAHLQAVVYAVAERAADLIKGVTPGPA